MGIYVEISWIEWDSVSFEEIWTHTHAHTEGRQWEEPQGKGHVGWRQGLKLCSHS